MTPNTESTRILQNALKITEQGKVTYLISTHQHHCNAYTLASGGSVFVDGGREYFRRSCIPTTQASDDITVEDWSLMEDDSRNRIYDRLLWGSRGKDGKQPLTFSPFKILEKTHLQAILEYADKLSIPLSPIQLETIRHWLEQK